MDSLWTCRDPFQDRNKFFRGRHIAFEPISPPTISPDPYNSTTRILMETFNQIRMDSPNEERFQTNPFNRSRTDLTIKRPVFSWPPLQCQPETRRRERTISSDSSDSSPVSSNMRVAAKPLGPNYCTFCKTNKETKSVYGSHTLKAFVNNKSIVTCPVLRKLECRICGATGDDAHTITHCPEGSIVVPIAKELKNNSGNRRYAD